MSAKKITTLDLISQKNHQKIVAVTAYDYSMAKLFDEWVDVILVGDSLGSVIQGEKTTLQVTIEDMIYHTKAVSKALSRAHLAADMPFMSYQVSIEEALKNAGRLLSEGNAESVKLEGGAVMAETIHRLVSVGIPVMGHIGLTPQSVHGLGGYLLQGKTEESRNRILKDAIAVEQAGAYALVLEMVPKDLAKEITSKVSIPTIGIGAGVTCDGQILVGQDLLGMNPSFKPKFLRKFANLHEVVAHAMEGYRDAVRGGTYPSEEESF